MRRVKRLRLSAKVAQKLRDEQADTDAKAQQGTLDAKGEWDRARRNIPLRTAFSTLTTMAGERARCMYCGDSKGTDIEHFWPKTSYPSRMFRWSNMLLGCTDCGRDHKGQQFPLDLSGMPLLIKPTIDDPWAFLDLEPGTGILTERYDSSGAPIEKGKKTVEVLALDQREALAAGYKRSFDRIKAEMDDAVNVGIQDMNAFAASLKLADEHGVLGWCFRGAGINESPSRELREQLPEVWNFCVREFHYY